MNIYPDIKGRYRSAARYNQILKVLVKYGFEDLVYYLEKQKKYGFVRGLVPRTTRKHALSFNKWEKMRLVCEELGPTFVKFGQIMSNHAELIPAELISELEKLQDRVPPMPEKMARETVEKELKGDVDELFAWFDSKPFASASMAQVHIVTLHSGKRVALKIQRPGIRETIFEDIKLMYNIAEVLAKRIPSLNSFDPVGLVSNFEESILKELDFIHESINVQRFYNNIVQDESHDQYAHAPKVYQEFTTDKVLALEFMSGIKIDKILALNENGHDPKIIAHRLTKTYFKQIFDYGFFHADPHPGNLLVLPNSHICYLDFGMMGSILPRDIQTLGQLFLSITRKDVNKIIKALQRLSNNQAIDNIRQLEFDINEFVEKHYVREVHKNELSTIMMELKDIIVFHGLKVPTHFYLFARSLVTIEGVIQKLDPDLDQLAMVRPYLLKAISKKFNPAKMGEKAINSLYELGNYMEEFPRDLKNAIRKINSGQVKVDITHKGIDPMVHTLHRVTKQIITAFIMSALIIGATLFIISEIEPLWGGFSVIGIVCLIITAILGIGMLRDVRKGDHDDSEVWNE